MTVVDGRPNVFNKTDTSRRGLTLSFAWASIVTIVACMRGLGRGKKKKGAARGKGEGRGNVPARTVFMNSLYHLFNCVSLCGGERLFLFGNAQGPLGVVLHSLLVTASAAEGTYLGV